MLLLTYDIKDVKFINHIPNFNFDKRYVVTQEGNVFRVKNITKGKLTVTPMLPFITRDGYTEYVLTNKYGEKKHIQAHRLVAWAWLDKPKDKDYVNHKDLNRTNNHVDNLEWTTQGENLKHSYANNPDRPRHNQYTKFK